MVSARESDRKQSRRMPGGIPYPVLHPTATPAGSPASRFRRVGLPWRECDPGWPKEVSCAARDQGRSHRGWTGHAVLPGQGWPNRRALRIRVRPRWATRPAPGIARIRGHSSTPMRCRQTAARSTPPTSTGQSDGAKAAVFNERFPWPAGRIGGLARENPCDGHRTIKDKRLQCLRASSMIRRTGAPRPCVRRNSFRESIANRTLTGSSGWNGTSSGTGWPCLVITNRAPASTRRSSCGRRVFASKEPDSGMAFTFLCNNSRPVTIRSKQVDSSRATSPVQNRQIQDLVAIHPIRETV